MIQTADLSFSLHHAPITICTAVGNFFIMAYAIGRETQKRPPSNVRRVLTSPNSWRAASAVSVRTHPATFNEKEPQGTIWMLIKTVRSEIVSHLSYLVASKGEAFVVDPRRDCEVYNGIAQDEGVRIREIFETHRNEDYVVGSLELSRMTGARIHHGPGLPWSTGRYSVTAKSLKSAH